MSEREPRDEPDAGRIEGADSTGPGFGSPTVPPESPDPGPSPGALAAFGHRDYRVFWVGALVSNVGSWMQTVAQGWLVLELTDSAFMLGLVGFAGTLPMLVLLLVGGVFADRFDRRRLLIVTLSGMMVFATVLAWLTWADVVRVWHILVLSLGAGSAIALAAPAYQAYVHDLVGRRDLQNAIALNSAQFNLSRIVGPSLAGLLVGGIGLAGCFGLNAASYLASLGALLMIRARGGGRGSGRASTWDSIQQGLAYVRERRRIPALLGLTALVSVLAMPYSTLLPIIARDVLGLDASGLGYLFAVGGVGAVVGAMSLAFRGIFRRRGIYLLGCGIGAGAATLGLGLARTTMTAAIALVALSFAATSVVALTNTLLQELVDDRMRGRVLSMFGLAFMGTFPIGNLLAGSVAGLTSASFTLAASGAVLVVGIGWIAWARPSVRRLS